MGIKLNFAWALILFLPIACSNPQKDAIKKLEKSQVKFTESAFLVIIDSSDIEKVKLFLTGGMSANAKDHLGRRPLVSAAHYGNIEIAKLLLDHGADINATTETQLYLLRNPRAVAAT